MKRNYGVIFAVLAVLVCSFLPVVASALVTSVATVNFPADGTVLKGGSLVSVSCFETSKCVAVGSYWSDTDAVRYPVVVRFDGTSAIASRASNPSGLGDGSIEYGIASVDCLAGGVCWAVGNLHTSSYIAKITATAWETSYVSLSDGGSASDLRSISCWSPTKCAVAGRLQNQNFAGGGTAAVGFIDSGVTTLSALNPPTGESNLMQVVDISCISSGKCLAIGSYFSEQGVKYFTSSFDGASWTSQTLVLPSDALPQDSINFSAYQARVSCSETAGCLIAGKYRGQYGSYYGFYGTSTSIQGSFTAQRLVELNAGPTSPTAGSAFLVSDVVCTGSLSCIVSGDLQKGSTQKGFALHFKDSKFSNTDVLATLASSSFGNLLTDCIDETKCFGLLSDRYLQRGTMQSLGTFVAIDLSNSTTTTMTSPAVTSPTVTAPTVTSPTVTAPTVMRPTVTTSKSASVKSIAAFAKLKVLSTSKVSLKVARTSAKYCKVVGTKLKGLKVGSCKVTVTVTPKKGRAKFKTVTLKVTR
jgi:hypothetical protein